MTVSCDIQCRRIILWAHTTMTTFMGARRVFFQERTKRGHEERGPGAEPRWRSGAKPPEADGLLIKLLTKPLDLATFNDSYVAIFVQRTVKFHKFIAPPCIVYNSQSKGVANRHFHNSMFACGTSECC